VVKIERFIKVRKLRMHMGDYDVVARGFLRSNIWKVTKLFRKREPKEVAKEPQQAYFSGDLIAIYTVFRDQVYNPQSVLYPGCEFDGSPAKVFENVTFVDAEKGNQGCVQKLQEAGLHALKQDIGHYSPAEQHDLLILLNPAIPTELTTRHLRSGGYVLANNYHLDASWINAQKDRFSLVGIIDYDPNTNSARFAPNEDGQLDRTVSIDDIAESRPLEHWAFKNTKFTGQSEVLPFERVADKYIFVKK